MMDEFLGQDMENITDAFKGNCLKHPYFCFLKE